MEGIRSLVLLLAEGLSPAHSGTSIPSVDTIRPSLSPILDRMLDGDEERIAPRTWGP